VPGRITVENSPALADPPGTDLEYHDAVAALSDPRPQTEHYLAADISK
jgi:hypothetical protein